MKSNRSLIRYKHDVIGKFKEITSVISPLDDGTECPPKYFELFLIVHGLLMKMIPASRETISELFSEKSELHVVNQIPEKLVAKKILVGELEFYQVFSNERQDYYYVLDSSDQDRAIFMMGKALSLLPVKKTVIEIQDAELQRRIFRLL